MHCVVSGLYTGQISGNLSSFWWIYFRRSRLMRGYGFTCVGYVVKDGALLWEAC